MKVLHTSDWHIGQLFHNYSREEEHKYFFEQLKTLIIKEKPDVATAEKYIAQCKKHTSEE